MAAKKIARDYGTVCADWVSGSALNSQEVPVRPSHERYIPLTAPVWELSRAAALWKFGTAVQSYTTFQLECLYHILCSGAPFHLRLEPSALTRASPLLLQLAHAPASWLHPTLQFPPGWDQLPPSATSDQTTGWTLGLTNSPVLSNPVTSTVQIAWDCAWVGKSPACIILNCQLIPPCRAALLFAAPRQTTLKNLQCVPKHPYLDS